MPVSGLLGARLSMVGGSERLAVLSVAVLLGLAPILGKVGCRVGWSSLVTGAEEGKRRYTAAEDRTVTLLSVGSVKVFVQFGCVNLFCVLYVRQCVGVWWGWWSGWEAGLGL